MKLEEDEILVDSIMFRLIQVAENSEKLTEKFKETYPSIPWSCLLYTSYVTEEKGDKENLTEYLKKTL